MNRQTKVNYIYKIQLTATHNAKCSENMTMKTEAKKPLKTEILKKTKSYVANIQYNKQYAYTYTHTDFKRLKYTIKTLYTHVKTA